MKNAINAVADVTEKAVRQFVRASFAARVAKVDGEYQSAVRKNDARVVITNPDTVLENLELVCGAPIAETATTKTFNMFGLKGKKAMGTVALMIKGETATLILVNA